ncbi:la-related protein 7 [Teleopsis dalmanni]|uniref:la-related protein 7 n=1 Tax=Teleopsis dalmanni TaxID=139649 RepID=UPI0018CDEA3F|nr:la-related protein 7 [Teleopsis dalmanni]
MDNQIEIFKSSETESKTSPETSSKTAVADCAVQGTENSHRKRHKQYFNAIRAQMEFYFGDANLSKDRFLKQLIDKDPFVPLEVFLNFNKVKTLTSKVEDISKALSNSDLLELDETTKLKVRRKTEIPKERNVDEKTLYIESLPPTADHDWIRKHFERYGAVSYVSLPKYETSKKIKGFAFVEFEQEKSVAKALHSFVDFDGVLNVQETEPSKLRSVQSYITENKSQDIVPEIVEKSAKKRCVSVESADDVAQPKVKRIKENDNDDTKTASTSETEGGHSDDKMNSDMVKCKKNRRKKSKGIKKYQKEADLNTDPSFYELKILPKRDWKRLRNKYLNLQREKVSEIKRKLWKEKLKTLQESNDATSNSNTSAPPPSKKIKTAGRKLHKMNMNFYGAGEDEAQSKNSVKETKQNQALERQPLFSYESGLIVEILFIEPCVDIKEFKANMRQYTTIKYVDVKEGSLHAHVRLENPAAAVEFVQRVNCAEYQMKILTGEAEQEYWKKIEGDREMKLNKQIKVPQKRGREKIKKVLTKHIRFDDDN